jgi:hypothetical protein
MKDQNEDKGRNDVKVRQQTTLDNTCTATELFDAQREYLVAPRMDKLQQMSVRSSQATAQASAELAPKPSRSRAASHQSSNLQAISGNQKGVRNMA